jgi:hypothetical protein
MKLTTNSILIIFGTLAMMLLACVPITILAVPLVSRSQTRPVDSVATVQAMATQTVVALTLTAPTQAPPTPTPLPLTPTVVPPTNTAVPTSTPVSYCDWAAFVNDVSIPDGSWFSAGETFTKIWRLKNRGTCTWTPDYLLVFNSGSQMGGTTAVRLPAYVAPGQTVDLSVTLTAPASFGHYTGYWSLRNPSGALFGSGNHANAPFYVDINVQAQDLPHGTVTGSLCYPSEFNPPMTLYFEKAGTVEKIQFSIVENQNYYSVLLPNGTYYAYAWAPGYNLEGAYVNPDRTMRTFQVRGGQTTTGINLCDWDPAPHARGQ